MRNSPSSSLLRFPARQRQDLFQRRPLAPSGNAMTCLALFQHAATDKALLVSDCGDEAKAVWCPKAMLIVEREAREGVIVAAMPKFVAEQKHLWPRFVDTAGWTPERIEAFHEAEALAAREAQPAAELSGQFAGTFRQEFVRMNLPDHPRPWKIQIGQWTADVIDASGDSIMCIEGDDDPLWPFIVRAVNRFGSELWQPIETLRRIDTDIVLWNPCDGVHLVNVATTGLRELETIRTGGVFTHWRKLDAPQVAEPEAGA